MRNLKRNRAQLDPSRNLIQKVCSNKSNVGNQLSSLFSPSLVPFSCVNHSDSQMEKTKYSVYQVFTRLFGNTHTVHHPWGTIAQNGVGKFSDFTPRALNEIKKLGVSHIWYTGVPHHAVIHDYSEIGVTPDHPAVVKGRAGSPYAVKDYYSVNPDLADRPEQRLQEFEALIKRSHQAGLKVIIDIVPNHVARNYHGLNNPAGIDDFGTNDDTSVEYHKDNNFYYIPEQAFELPDFPEPFSPLGGEAHPMLAAPYLESPAKWTGNGAQRAKPHFDDWYETVKINYGVRPDGTKDFDVLPPDFAQESCEVHAQFWRKKSVPDSWQKFKEIALYWLDKGVDGFRYDMAEMVPVEFWSYLNSAIKQVNPDAFLLAEVYQPDRYREYLHLGKMDYLYDKVDLYDGLKAIIQGHAGTDIIAPIQQKVQDIEHHMLHFLDNHDEQRLAHHSFAGSGEKGKPAMLVSTLLSSSPTMIYFGQEVAEPGIENAGFGQPSRTSIFDYIAVPEHQKWFNHGQCDGGLLSDSQRKLRQFYQSLLNFSLSNSAVTGSYIDMYEPNKASLGKWCHAFARWDSKQQILAITNFHAAKPRTIRLIVEAARLGLKDGHYTLIDAISDSIYLPIEVINGIALVDITLAPLAAHALVVSN